MDNFINSPLFYIVLAVILILVYVILSDIFKRRKKKKKDKKAKEDKKEEQKSDAKDEVVEYEKFEKESTSTPAEDFVPLTDDDAPVKSFEEQALDFLNDEENERLFEEFFGTSTSDLFATDTPQTFDYAIKEYDYDKVWEYVPEEINYDYNYDVNYTRPKKTSRIKKEFKKMNNTQKAIVFANIFKHQKIKN